MTPLGRLALALALLPTAIAARGQEDDLARELPRIPAHEPADAMSTIALHPGFRLERIAAEPLVRSPMSVAYDADGALYVVEMRGYPFVENQPSGSIARLTDDDGDGTFDTRTVFLDGLMWPTGVVPHDGGVFIAVAPEILYAKDLDGDGKADVRRVVFSGFGTNNVQGLLNSLRWGDDGWIHGVASSNGGTIKTIDHPDRPEVSVRGRDFRFKPDTLEFQTTSGGGQFGGSVDDWGHVFTCNNSNQIRQIVLPAPDVERNPAYVPPPAILDIPSDGPAGPVFRISKPEPWRVVRTRQRVADPEMKKKLAFSEQFAFGYFTSATGVTIYRGTAYPEEFRGNAFIGDVGGNLVHRKTLKVAGAAYVADRADAGVEFLASTDNWFRPVCFANTPNGTLLIIDMYRETIEHPDSIPEPIKKHLDLTSGKDRGRLYELLTAKGPRPLRKPSLSKAPSAELVPLLADPDGWWRDAAQRLLIERKAVDVAPALEKLARERPTPLARHHALCVLDALDVLKTADIGMALADPEPRVRETAARIAQRHLKADPGLIANVVARADDADPMVRFRVALTLGEAGDDPRALDALAAIAVRDAGDRYARAAVLTAIPGRGPDLLARLSAGDFLSSAAGRPWLDDLATMIGQAKDPKAVAKVIDDLYAGNHSDELRGRVVLALGAGLKRVRGSLRETLAPASWERLAPLFDAAAKTADSDEPAPSRVAAVALVGLSGPERSLEALPGLLDARQPSEVQLAALRALAALEEPKVADAILKGWKTMSPAARREAAEVLFSRAPWIDSLLDAVEAKSLAASEIDPLRLKQLREHPSATIRDRALKLLGANAPRERSAVIAAFRPALEGEGDRDKGKAVYLKACATCHKAEGQGTEVGPDLATVAARTPEDILTHVLDPNREIASNYLNYNVETADGRVVSGIIASESAAALVLKRAEGVTEIVPRAEIEQIASTGISLMPEGLEKDLTPDDFRDLIAFVRSIRAPEAPAAK